MSRATWLILVLLLIVVIAAVYFYRSRTALPTADQAVAESTAKTDLEIEIVGGFAFVPEANMLHVAYLNDVTMTGATDNDPATADTDILCNVHQLGTELVLSGGAITTPNPPPPTNKFDLRDTVVTFLDLPPAAVTAVRGPRPPSPGKPTDATSEAAWEDLKFIASRKLEHKTGIDPRWREKVNGRVELRGGKIIAGAPSQGIPQESTFEFKSKSGTTYEQAVTDRAIYRVSVPSSTVRLRLTKGLAVTDVVIQPAADGRVVLRLLGVHDPDAPEVPPGGPLNDSCAFYSLMQPTPKFADWLIPHYVAAAASGVVQGKGHGSPGFFCPGDWF